MDTDIQVEEPVAASSSSSTNEVEDNCFDVDEWEELMNGNIFKKVIQQGKGESSSMGTIVKCNIKGYIQNATDSGPFENLMDQMFKIGESDAFPGLELTLRHAKVGEIYIMRCSSRFGFGPFQRPEIKQGDGSIIPLLPADSDLEY